MTSISRAVYGARCASPVPVATPGCLPVSFEPLSAPRGARRGLAPAAESTFGVRLRERDPWADLVREAGPFPPEGGAVEGERDLFVPIFAISGIIGFFGLYTYETIRIGCLFTPFGTFGGACD